MSFVSNCFWTAVENLPFKSERMQMDAGFALFRQRFLKRHDHFAGGEAVEHVGHAVAGEKVHHFDGKEEVPTLLNFLSGIDNQVQ